MRTQTAAAEASACEIPIVVTCVDGLAEVVLDGITGLLVPPENPQAAAAAIGRLLADSRERSAMGNAGRHFVQETFEWDVCVNAMLDVYRMASDSGARYQKRTLLGSATRRGVSIEA